MKKTFDEIVESIQIKTGKSIEDISNLINSKKEQYSGLLTKDGAAYVTASDFDVDLDSTILYKPKITKIGKIDRSYGVVSLQAYVLNITEIREFYRKDGTSGKHCSLFVFDKTGKIRLVLWNEQTNLVEKKQLEEANVVEIQNVYPKMSRYGNLELHSGNSTRIKVVSEYDADDYSPPKIEQLSIDQIMADSFLFSTKAKIIDCTPLRVFTRKDGTQGQVINLLIADKNEKIYFAFWNEDVEKAKKIIDDGIKVIRITNPRVKIGSNNQLELTMSKDTTIMTISDPELEKIEIKTMKDIESLPLVPINKIAIEDSYSSVGGIITRIYPEKTFYRTDGSESRVGSLHIADKTGEIRVALWDEHVSQLAKLKVNLIIKLQGFKPKKDKNGELELHTTEISKIIIEPTDVEIASEDFFKNIAFINDRMFNLTIRVKILEKETIREFAREDGSTAVVLNIRIEDLTGKARLSAWDQEIEIIKDVESETWIEVTGIRSRLSELGIDLTMSKASQVTKLKEIK